MASRRCYVCVRLLNCITLELRDESQILHWVNSCSPDIACRLRIDSRQERLAPAAPLPLEKDTKIFGEDHVGVEHNDAPGDFPLPGYLAQHILTPARKDVLFGLVV